MNSKAIVAIIVVVILIIAGAGVGIFFATKNSNDDGGLAVDKIKTTVEAGDYISQETNTAIKESVSSLTKESLLGMIYYGGTGEPVSEEKIKFKGTEYDCTVYSENTVDISYKYWVINGSNVVLKTYGIYEGSDVPYTDYKLADDTNIDVNLDISKQEVKIGTIIKISGIVYGNESDWQYKVTSVDEGNFEVEISIIQSGVDTKTVKEVDGDILVLTTGERMEKTNFYSKISLKELKNSLTKGGAIIEVKSQSKDTIDTKFGKRNVTIEMFDVMGDNSETEHYSVTYGENGALYKGHAETSYGTSDFETIATSMFDEEKPVPPGPTPSVVVDELKKEIAVGDYEIFELNETETSSSTCTELEYASNIYYTAGGTEKGTEEIVYKGVQYECTIYSYGSYTYWVNESGVCLKYDMVYQGRIIELVLDTNLNVNIGADEQDVSENSYVKYSGKDYRYTLLVTSYDGNIVEYEKTRSLDSFEINREVISISDTGELILNDGSTITKDRFISFLSYDLYMKNFDDKIVTPISKTQETRDYDFGRRNVTVEKFDVDYNDYVMHLTLEYGEKGVLYSTHQEYVNDGYNVTYNLDLTSTSMIVTNNRV